MSADEWQTSDKPFELKLSTKTLDDEPQVAEGSVKIYELQAPAAVHRAPLAGVEPWRYRGYRRGPAPAPSKQEPGEDLSNPNNWQLGRVIAESGFTTDTNGAAKLNFKVPVGAFRAVIETQDRFGKKVTGRLPLQVVNPDETKLAIKIPHLLAAAKWELQPGDEFMALWGTGYDAGRAFVEIEHRNKVIQSFWTTPARCEAAMNACPTEAIKME